MDVDLDMIDDLDVYLVEDNNNNVDVKEEEDNNMNVFSAKRFIMTNKLSRKSRTGNFNGKN